MGSTCTTRTTPPRRLGPVATESVLEAPPPRFTAEEIAAIAAELFGLRGVASDLGSERDQTFLIDDGAEGGVLKISNLGESPAVLDLETEAILHVSRVDPKLPVARPRPTAGGDYRPTFGGPDGTHFVRLFERLHGHAGGPELDDRALFDYGVTHSRLNLALRGFFHPEAGRNLLWHLQSAAELRPHTSAIPDESRRKLVENALDRFDQRVAPHWPELRAQVVHGDLNLDNVLLDDQGRIAAIVDFGDVGFSAQVADFAIGLASLLRGRPDGDVFRAARIAIDGYQSRIPLETLELDLLADLVAARLAAIVTISAWRVERYPENAAYIQAWDDDSWKLLELFERLAASMPPGSGLDTVMLVNSGSEANELAWRFALAATGGEAGIVTEHAYHGVTTAIADFSPEEWPAGYRPANVETIVPPGTGGTNIQAALEPLQVPLAATFLDGAFTSDGIRFPPAEEVAAIVDETHDAGGLIVADEVQAGHGRTGDHLWSFERYGITPDLVTLGKPMGNGYPVAAVITRREIAESLAATTHVFSTFGGNPVAAQAALAVLDVIEDERLVEHAARVGSRLVRSLEELGLEVRGRGLLAG